MNDEIKVKSNGHLNESLSENKIYDGNKVYGENKIYGQTEIYGSDTYKNETVNIGMPLLTLDDDEIADLNIFAGKPNKKQYENPFPETEFVDGNPEQYEKVKKAITDLLNAFNVNWDDPNYTNTPDRVTKAYLNYWLTGYNHNPEKEITVFPNQTGSDDMVIVKDMKFYSLCAHHLAQIEGHAAIAYIPNENLLGLSKLGRILDIYARRFQMQERIGSQVADALMRLIKPKGVMVVLYNVSHGCMSSRGVKLHEASTTTSTIRGCFEAPEVRAEALNLISIKRS